MSVLLNSFRQGNLSELLADYLLSSIGISTPVRRQDDHGFDFYCQLSDQEDGFLTFGDPYLIQIKSNYESILYGKIDAEKWKPEDISWLFRLKLPMFIGVVDKTNISIKIFRTTGLWFQFYEHPDASQIELKPRENQIDDTLKEGIEHTIVGWPSGKGNGKKYSIDLGNPIITISYNDFKDSEIMKKKKGILRQVIQLEQINIIYRDLNIRYFKWIRNNKTDQPIEGAGIMYNHDYINDRSRETFDSITPGLISLVIQLTAFDKKDELTAVKNLLKLLPNQEFYKQFKSQNPQAFDWVED